ncbi:hypothetical protein BH11PAT1_BH11PAT1_5970 [soil metagenome]
MTDRFKLHIKKHHVYYVSMLLMQLLGLYLTYLTSFDSRLQLLVVVMTTFIYIGWALLHHYVEHDLTSKIVVEYILMGALGISVIFFLLK